MADYSLHSPLGFTERDGANPVVGPKGVASVRRSGDSQTRSPAKRDRHSRRCPDQPHSDNAIRACYLVPKRRLEQMDAAALPRYSAESGETVWMQDLAWQRLDLPQ